MWKRLHLISVTEPCGPECLPRLECDCVACFFSSWLHFRKSERKVKGREIFTRWNAKAWPTMIAMEGSIVKFFFYFFSGVCWFATRWAVASTRWFSACWSCTARWWRFNMWWQPGGAWWRSAGWWWWWFCGGWGLSLRYQGSNLPTDTWNRGIFSGLVLIILLYFWKKVNKDVLKIRDTENVSLRE